MSEYGQLAHGVRLVAREEALRTSPPVERFRVISLDPLRVEAFGSDLILDHNEIDLSRGVRSRIREGDTVFMLTDRDGDRIMMGIFAEDVDDDTEADLHISIPFSAVTPVFFDHNLGKRPSVTIVDSAGTEWIGEIQHLSDDQCKFTPQHPFSGTAYFN